MLWIATWYAALSLATITIYWWDKRAAIAAAPRVRVRTLHTFELLGGWPGAFAAQRLFRHKTRDVKFLLVYWAIVAAHAAAWTAWFWARK